MSASASYAGTSSLAGASHRPGWAAVTAGALVATAVTVMLLALGASIGLGSVSANSGGNPSPTARSPTISPPAR